MCSCDGRVSPVHDHFAARPDYRPASVKSFVDLSSDPRGTPRSRAYQRSYVGLR
jgi:hypothetical protein